MTVVTLRKLLILGASAMLFFPAVSQAAKYKEQLIAAVENAAARRFLFSGNGSEMKP